MVSEYSVTLIDLICFNNEDRVIQRDVNDTLLNDYSIMQAFQLDADERAGMSPAHFTRSNCRSNQVYIYVQVLRKALKFECLARASNVLIERPNHGV